MEIKMGTNGNLESLSIIIPCFNEEDCLENFFSVLKQTVKENEGKFKGRVEYIFVNDGSSDRTAVILDRFAKNDENVIVYEFSRNFGKEAALSAGLKFSTGDYVVPIDADLQHPPQTIFQMLEVIKKQPDIDLVVAKRKSRKNESFIYRFCTKSFYDLMNKISNCEVPNGVGDFRLMRRTVVQALVNLPEKRRFMKGLYAWVGFKSEEIEYTVAERLDGKSKFTPLKLFSLAVDGLLDFSVFPLRVWGVIGFVIAFFAFLAACYILVSTLIFGIKTPGYASLIISVVFFGGVQLISIGVLGEYLGRVYNEAKGRPTYIIRKKVTHENKEF